MILKYDDYIKEGFVTKSIERYKKGSDRLGDIVEMEGVDNKHSFTDNNGVFHKRGYLVKIDNHMTLRELVYKLISIRGNNCDLNDIDVGNLTDFSGLFDDDNDFFQNFEFNGDISGWNMTNAENLGHMFHGSLFNGDLSKWEFKNLKNLKLTFSRSKYTGENGDLSKWNVCAPYSVEYCFYYSDYAGKFDNWSFDPYSVKGSNDMFKCSKFEREKPDIFHW